MIARYYAFFTLFFFFAHCDVGLAVTRYVNLANPTPMPPYTTWETAAQTIQLAVDIASTGDEIIVTNGVYRVGGRAVAASMTNRVAITKAVVVRSVNGPEFTAVEGYQLPGVVNGNGAIRCVYLTNGAFLSGFTLTNGATRTGGHVVDTRSGGGVLCASATAVVSNCVVINNAANNEGGGIYGGTILASTIVNNWSGQRGGGASQSILVDSILTENESAGTGGGLNSGSATNSILARNQALDGGGSAFAFLTGCNLVSNSCVKSRFGGRGGGAYLSTVIQSTISGNTAVLGGGGIYGGSVRNSAIYQNGVQWYGGGVYGSAVNNCTITGNSAEDAGGVFGGSLTNSIVYHNYGRTNANHLNSEFEYSCTYPLPASGQGNIASDPQLASAIHLSEFSPCLSAGTSLATSGLDIDGESWGSPPAMGSDQFQATPLPGELAAQIRLSYLNAAAGFEVKIWSDVVGQVRASVWEIGEGPAITNRPNLAFFSPTSGVFEIRLRCFNENNPTGIVAVATLHVLEQPVHYVSPLGLNPTPPFLSWATAARELQDAVEVAYAGGVVLATNGVYDKGGAAIRGNATNRVAVTKPLKIRSVNGPQFTTIQGYQVPGAIFGPDAVRVAHLGDDVTLDGFRITGGSTVSNYIDDYYSEGGGVWCDDIRVVVTNCIVSTNAAGYRAGGIYQGDVVNCTINANSARYGGGAAFSRLFGTIVSGNSASSFGGGGYAVIAVSCVFSNNSAGVGGGIYESTAETCLFVGNSAGTGGGCAYGSARQTVFWNNSTATMGGAAIGSALTNCTVVGNSASAGGGVYGGTSYNSIIYHNTIGGNHHNALFLYCCTTPLGFVDVRNFTNAPLFFNQVAGDFRLQPNSPCINAGFNAFASDAHDYLGSPRIAGGQIDLGAFEYQNPGSSLPYVYLQSFGLPTDGTVDDLDLDGDGHTTRQEWYAWTDPTNAASFLELKLLEKNGTNVSLAWRGIRGRNYSMEKSTNAIGSPSFSLLRSNLGTSISGEQLVLIDNTATNGVALYRLKVGF